MTLLDDFVAWIEISVAAAIGALALKVSDFALALSRHALRPR